VIPLKGARTVFVALKANIYKLKIFLL